MSHFREQLDAVACRIVAPLVASRARRRTMHEELLAHLHASYEEELARPGTRPDAALESAARRLGDPADLRRQLQSSVPLIERLFAQLVSRKENPMSRWIWLLAVCAFFVGAGMVLPALALIKQGVVWTPTHAFLFAVGILTTLGGVGTIAYGAVNGLRRRTAA